MFNSDSTGTPRTPSTPVTPRIELSGTSGIDVSEQHEGDPSLGYLHPSLQDRKNSANKLALELNSIIKSNAHAHETDENGIENANTVTNPVPNQQLPDVLQNSPANSRPASEVAPAVNVSVTPPSEGDASPSMARKGPPPPVRPRSIRRPRTTRPGPPGSTGRDGGGTNSNTL